MNKNPDRKFFSEIVSEAYFSADKIMGLPAIDYDPTAGKFSWCSSLTPASENEIRVEEGLEEGIFGFDFTQVELAEYIANHADHYWNSIIEEM